MKPSARVLAALALLLAAACLLVVVLLLHSTPVSPEPAPAPGAAETSEPAPSADDARTAGEVGGPGEPARPAPPPRLRLRVVRWPDGAPIPGATVALQTNAGLPLVPARTTAGGRLERELPAGTLSVLAAAEAEGFAATRQLLTLRPDADDLFELFLVPATGWIGRVTSAFGEGVPGARVSAWQHWTPRPAYLERDDGEVVLASAQGDLPAVVPAATNEEGYYYVEPFADSNVVDLVLAVVGTTLASTPLAVPLPLLDPQLPDLVVLPTEPLAGRVVDEYGRGLPGATLAIDRSPALWRAVEESTLSLGDGSFALARHLGVQALSVELWDHVFVRAFSGARAAGLEEGWIELRPGEGEVLLVLAGVGHLRALVRDAATGEPVSEALVTPEMYEDDGSWGRRPAARTGLDGTFHLLVHPDDLARPAAVSIEAAGYPPLRTEMLVEYDTLGSLVELFLAPRPGAFVLQGAVFGSPGRPVDARVQVWHGRAGAEQMLLAVLGSDEPPAGEPPTLLWEGRASAGGFAFRTEAAGSDLLLVAAESEEAGSARHGLWGPRRVAEAEASGMRVPLEPRLALAVEADGLLEGRRHLLQLTSWFPAGGSTWITEVRLQRSREGWSRASLELSARALGWVELRLERGPVSAPLAGTAGWRAAADLAAETLRLETPPFRIVQGEILWYAAADWPALCVALLGASVPEWRAEWLGESDWCARPGRDGRYRLQAPEGDYTLTLFRPAGRAGVEILAQRDLTLQQDLFHVDLWPERPSEGGLVVDG